MKTLALANCSALIYFPLTAPHQHTVVYYYHKTERANHSPVLSCIWIFISTEVPFTVDGGLLVGQGRINISLYESCIGCANGTALGITNQCRVYGRLSRDDVLLQTEENGKGEEKAREKAAAATTTWLS